MKCINSLFILLLIVLGTVIVFSSCKKFVETNIPSSQLLTPNVFVDDTTANSAVNGLYASLSGGTSGSGLVSSVTVLTGLCADELTYLPNAAYDDYKNNSISPLNSNLGLVWTSCYRSIYQANAIMEGLNTSTGVSPAKKSQFRGEALFARAYCYFLLAQLYGDAPLQLTTDVNVNKTMARTDRQLVMAQVKADLLQAKDLLPANYSISNNERVRANKYVAAALLARYYLYTGNWQDAATQASELIGASTMFSLLTDLNAVFLKNSQEAIWQFWEPNGYTPEAFLILPTGGSTPNYVVTPNLLAAFAPGDLRAAAWLKPVQTYYCPYKYKIANATSGNEYHMLLRLAEQYLIRAEARAHLQDFAGAKADLNAIRSRAGLAASSASDEATLLQAVEAERQRELFSENGHRWFDLIRTGRANAVLGAVKGAFWQPTDVLFPIPQKEIGLNSRLTQNPGY